MANKKNFLLNGKKKVIEKIAKFKFHPKKKLDVKVRHFSQRQANRLFLGCVIGVVALSGLVILSNTVHVFFGNKVSKVQVFKDKGTNQFANQVNLFMGDYLDTYFNRDKDTDLDELKKYYGSGIDIKGQESRDIDMKLEHVSLVEIKSSVAVYDINYQIKDGDNWKSVLARINVPYKEKDGRYYVSDLPYYTDQSSYVADTVKGNSKLPTQSEVEGLSNKKLSGLKDYIVAFFKAYTSGDNSQMAPFSGAVSPLKSYEFEELDYAYFIKHKHSIIAVVQVTFKNEFGVKHQENFTLEVTESKQTSSYYVKSMKHGIDEGCRKEMKMD
ncbi:TPA: conjugal transfer protein [Streptococcus mutans]